jgi:hypothetical protein
MPIVSHVKFCSCAPYFGQIWCGIGPLSLSLSLSLVSMLWRLKIGMTGMSMDVSLNKVVVCEFLDLAGLVPPDCRGCGWWSEREVVGA